MQNRFYRNMADALSGTQEFMASEALYELHADQRFDLVVVDTPPSRNALDFLEAPGVLARFLDHTVFRLMMLPTRTGLHACCRSPASRSCAAIGRVVGSDALADAAAFFQAFAGMEGGFRERAEVVASLLQADTTRFVLVTSPRRETVDEAAWFADQLIDLGFGVAAVVANRVHPRFGGDHGRRGRGARASAVPTATRGTTKRRCGATSPSCVTSPKPSATRSRRCWRAHLTDRRSRSRCCPPTCTTSTALDHIAAHLELA